MKKLTLLLAVFCLAAGAVFAQNPAPNDDLLIMNAVVRGLASELNKKLTEERAVTAAMGDFTFEGTVRPFSQYLSNQFIEELVNQRGSYSVISAGPSASDFSITGEIVDLSNVIRVYARLVRTSDKAIRAAFSSDFERNETIVHMLSSTDGRRRSAMVARDALEDDSWDNPVSFEIGADDSARFVDRSIHSGTDEDFFLLLPDRDGRLSIETSGNIDTFMELYNADRREMLTSDDDSGSGGNARIRYNVTAGRRYIVKVRGYDSDTLGLYSFRAHYYPQVVIMPDEYEPDNDFSSAKTIEIGTRQQRTFHNGNDIDWVRFQVIQRGRYILRARGANNGSLDTYIELYGADMNSIGEDDDGGDDLDSRLSINLEPGFYYCKIRYLDNDPDQPYIFSIDRE